MPFRSMFNSVTKHFKRIELRRFYSGRQLQQFNVKPSFQLATNPQPPKTSNDMEWREGWESESVMARKWAKGTEEERKRHSAVAGIETHQTKPEERKISVHLRKLQWNKPKNISFQTAFNHLFNMEDIIRLFSFIIYLFASLLFQNNSATKSAMCTEHVALTGTHRQQQRMTMIAMQIINSMTYNRVEHMSQTVYGGSFNVIPFLHSCNVHVLPSIQSTATPNYT